VLKLNVGCGPDHIKQGWYNVDVRPFPGIDQVRDATLPFDDIAPLEYVYSEHFLEHLSLEDALKFLQNAASALAPHGRMRLSTPSLEWVLATHFDLKETDSEAVVIATMVTNRAFHGWGHQFVWSKPMLHAALLATGFSDVIFCEYGRSGDPSLARLEQHGDYHIHVGWPSVWIVEAGRAAHITVDQAFIHKCEHMVNQHVRGGH
jgi:predicted SAM-dependent methyltransferase